MQTELDTTIARSKEFLAKAVSMTKAESVTFQGKPAYKVTGNLRSYAVVIETAKVYDWDSQKYRCIVNDNRYSGVGYDDVASRLLALKNDSLMVDTIGTLGGEAQPQYEDMHRERTQRDTFTDTLEHAFNNHQ
jgi:hypothetical protein